MQATSHAVRSRRLAGERLLFDKTRDAPLRICLAYPNRYAVAMGNLGFQAVYEIIDGFPGAVCERAFVPDEDEAVDAGGLRTLESGRRVRDFDLIALSISFETDYLHLPRLFELIGIPSRSAHRAADHPLVMAGGPAMFLNPEPVADFLDLVLIGEAEEMLPEFLAVFAGGRMTTGRGDLLERVAAEVAGAYVPSHYEPVFDGARLVDHGHRDGAGTVERRLIWDLNRFPTSTRVLSEEAVFGDMVMVEASRGCQWGCRFCAAGFMYRPIRTRSPEQLSGAVAEGLRQRGTIGLVGAEMASVPGVAPLAAQAVAAGGRLSPSSLKADCVTPTLAATLAAGGTRSATIAPEAGSERMRRIINKNLSEEDILRAAELMVGGGVDHLKLYFMIGLPEETPADVAAIAELVGAIRARLGAGAKGAHRLGRVTVSVNPFVPKPWTPFQWDPMRPLAELRRSFRELRRMCGRIPNLEVDTESPREGYLQTLLSRGDRRMSRVIEQIHASGGDWWRTIREWQRHGIADMPHPDEYVHRTYAADETFAWDFIDHRIAKSYLWVERRKAFAERQTAPCDTATCTSCAAC